MSQTHNQTLCEPNGCDNNDGGDDFQQIEQCKIQDTDGKTSNVPECAVCLQQCIHPACLPCNHVFCYLCVKGVANQSKRCPMCRQEIPSDFLEHPQLLQVNEQQQLEVAHVAADNSSQGEYQWFYEGRNGWWQYDQRTNIELETAYKQKKQTCELLIAGFLYIADFGSMFQVRRNDHSRRRRIKRDVCNAPKKGIAGLRLNDTTSVCDHGNQQQQQQQQQQQHQRQHQSITDYIQSIDQTMDSRNVQSTTDFSSRPSLTADITDINLPISNTESTSSSDNSNFIAAITTTRQFDQSRQTNTLHQVLEQMRSVELRGNVSSTSQQNSNNDGSILDYSSLPWFHQTSSNAVDSSDEEEHT